MKKISNIALLVGAAAIVAGCGGKGRSAAGQGADTTGRVLVATGTVTTQRVERTVELTSDIEPNQKNNIAGIAGRITDIKVRVGDRVERGQLLVVMDQTQYQTTMVQLANLEQDYQRLKAVYEAGGVSSQQIDQMEAQLKVLRESARSLKENTELVSPLTGVVTARNFDPGDQVAGMPILQVMEISTVKVTIGISEQFFPMVRLGMPVDINVDILPGKHFRGNISLIYPTIDPSSRTFTVEVRIPNYSGVLRPGMFSRTTVNLGMVDAVLVPDLAVIKQSGTNERFVFVIGGDSVAHRRVVTLDRQIGDRFIVDSGLQAGETVAMTGQTKLIEGTSVEVRNDAALNTSADQTASTGNSTLSDQQ